MRTTMVVSAVVAAVVALTLFDATPSDAAVKGRSVSRSVQRAPSRAAQPRIHKPAGNANKFVKKGPSTTFVKKGPSTPLVKKGASTTFVKKGTSPNFVKKSTIGAGTLNLRRLPVQEAAVGSGFLKGRMAVPHNMKPKLTLTHAPGKKFHHNFSPFVQRHWKKAFFWVAVAGIGYVTIPQLYYDRFYTYAGANPPNYPQACQVLQDAAAVTDEKDAVRISMPSDASYRYEADTAPTQECKSCTLQPFVERKWNKEYVWVQVPQTGNVTVPEDSYDRFYGYASAEPPNYPAACTVLVEAAAADTVMTTALDTSRGEDQ